MSSSGTDTTFTYPNVYHLAVNRYGFDYPVFEEDNGDWYDVDVSDYLYETNIEYGDEANEEFVPPVAQTANLEGENHLHPVQLRRSQGVLFQRLENFPEPAIRYLFE